MTNHSANYNEFFKTWAVKTHGSKPSEAMIEQAHLLGCAHGKQCLVVAMSLRPEGVTRPQMLHAVGNPQANKMGGLVTDAYLKRDMSKAKLGVHTVYKNDVTPKGQKRIDSRKAAIAALEAAGKVTGEAKPAKGAKAKAVKKPKVKAAKGPVTVPPPNELPVADVEPVAVPDGATSDQLPVMKLIA